MLLVVVAVGQFDLTLAPAQDRINVHLAEMSQRLSESTDNVQKLINRQYLSACRIAAKILTEKPEYRTREGMETITCQMVN
ncbi:MAG: hypothetical protein IJV04_08965 [Lachnospiraceae bacterium]|nr:hypothetical protein [Lachnospiraceae bacterium]